MMGLSGWFPWRKNDQNLLQYAGTPRYVAEYDFHEGDILTVYERNNGNSECKLILTQVFNNHELIAHFVEGMFPHPNPVNQYIAQFSDSGSGFYLATLSLLDFYHHNQFILLVNQVILIERRNYTRKKCIGDVQLSLYNERRSSSGIPGTLIDVSQGGVALSSELRLRPFSFIYLTIDSSEVEQGEHLIGKVIRVQKEPDYGFKIGVQLMEDHKQ